MGSLVAAGALSGLGQGLVDEVKDARDTDKEQRQAEKEVRLRQMEIDYQKEQTKNNQTFQSGQTDKEIKARSDIENSREKGEMSRAQMNRDSIESEGDKNRDAANERAKLKAALSASSKKVQPRWKQVMTKTAAVDPVTKLLVPGANTQISVFDQKSARTYTQVGDKFVPQGVDLDKFKPKADPNKARAAIADLMKNPDKVDDFVDAFGYVPAQFIEQMPNQMVSSTSTKAPVDEEDDE